MSEKIVVVTGGSVGIGASVAQKFAHAGWRVLSVARRPCPIEGVIHVSADFTDASWEETAARAFDAHVVGKQRICVVHNAAVLEKDDALSLTAERMRRVLEINVVAPAVLNRLLRPRMLPSSSILYVGSTLSEKAVANTASYVTSKHAVAGLMRATAQDLVGTGIHTACVCPGFVDTEMLRAHVGNDADVLRALAGMSGFGRLLLPEEIASLLLFCADNPAISGALLHANLGQIEH